jgi:Tfp pilus assembly protein PilF
VTSRREGGAAAAQEAAAAFASAQVLAMRGELSRARAALEDLLAGEPEHVPAILLQASLLLQLREEDAALRAFARAAALAPRSSEALNGLARCLHALGRDDEALEVAREARACLEVGDNFRHAAPVYLTIVWCLREQRKFKEALAAAEEGLARCADAVLAQWASVVEEELAEAEQERC